MSAPKLRMVAGPNGSGKSTLLEYLRGHFRFPLGYSGSVHRLVAEFESGRYVSVAAELPAWFVSFVVNKGG